MGRPPSKPASIWRAKYAALRRCVKTGERQPDDPELLEARRNLATEMLAEHVERIVREAPPLTDEQRARITALLQVSA